MKNSTPFGIQTQSMISKNGPLRKNGTRSSNMPILMHYGRVSNNDAFELENAMAFFDGVIIPEVCIPSKRPMSSSIAPMSIQAHVGLK